MNMHVWFHSRKANGVNPASVCRSEALYFIGCYPNTYLKYLFHVYLIILNRYLRRSLILSIEKQPITDDLDNFWTHFHHIITYMEVISCLLNLRQ